MKQRIIKWLFRGLRSFYTWYFDLVLRTTRWNYIGFEPAEADIKRGIPRIYCSWHARLAASPYFRDWDDHAMTAIANRNPVAQTTTLLMKRKRIEVILLKESGSKTGAIRAAVKVVRGGSSLGITPDGPLGPRYVVQPGAVMIAALSQTRLSAVAYSTRRRLVLKTWDRFVFPLPFGRGVFVMADGDIPPRRMDAGQMAAAQEKLAGLITEVTERADQIVDQKSAPKKGPA